MLPVSCSTARSPKTARVVLYGELAGFSSVLLTGGPVTVFSSYLIVSYSYLNFVNFIALIKQSFICKLL